MGRLCMVGVIWLVYYFDPSAPGLFINLGVTVGLAIGPFLD
jgi:hypothetical protein